MKIFAKSLAILCICLIFKTFAQQKNKYWVELNPNKILVNTDFVLDTLTIESKSTWLNAFTSYLTEEQMQRLAKHDFVASISTVGKYKLAAAEDKMPKYGDYIVSLNPAYFEKNNIDGKGVLVGVIDAGFVNVNKGPAYQHIVSENRLLGYQDFILDTARADFFDQQTSGDFHGANVLAYCGGYNPDTKQRIGLASGASYYLARTENGASEQLVEEDDWIEAIEWMYSKGVRLVNTSLGYSEFDDTTTNHTIYDMNGKTTKISIAAQIAVDKGMILVCSAGNSGAKPWRYVCAPADAEGVISVGATKKEDYAKEGYSSVGPEFNNYIKPDISTYSDRGTSYSAPEMTGLVACMLQKYPNLSPKQVKEALAIAGHMNPLPNNYVGYGVPDPEILFEYLAGKEIKPKEVKMLVVNGDFAKIRIADTMQVSAVVFHKIDKVHVQDQLRISNKKIDSKTFKELVKKGLTNKTYTSKIRKSKTTLKLYRPEGVRYSTIVINNKDLIEIEWRD